MVLVELAQSPRGQVDLCFRNNVSNKAIFSMPFGTDGQVSKLDSGHEVEITHFRDFKAGASAKVKCHLVCTTIILARHQLSFAVSAPATRRIVDVHSIFPSQMCRGFDMPGKWLTIVKTLFSVFHSFAGLYLKSTTSREIRDRRVFEFPAEFAGNEDVAIVMLFGPSSSRAVAANSCWAGKRRQIFNGAPRRAELVWIKSSFWFTEDMQLPRLGCVYFSLEIVIHVRASATAPAAAAG